MEPSTLALELLGVLTEICHSFVLGLESADSWLLFNEALLPFVKDVDYCELFRVRSDLAIVDECVVDFKDAVFRFDGIEVNACEAAPR